MQTAIARDAFDAIPAGAELARGEQCESTQQADLLAFQTSHKEASAIYYHCVAPMSLSTIADIEPLLTVCNKCHVRNVVLQ